MEFGGFSAGPGTAQRGASEGCVAESLSQAVQCQNGTQQLMNPIPCRVTAHGKKLHLEQNEVVMYGMTHVVAVDGYLLDTIAI